MEAKIADFGISRLTNDKNDLVTSLMGSLGYLDPEYYMSQRLTEKSDVYSFGVVLLELITARKPIERGKYIVKEIKSATDKLTYIFHQKGTYPISFFVIDDLGQHSDTLHQTIDVL